MSNKLVRGDIVADSNRVSGWIDRELAACDFEDERLHKRFRVLLEKLSTGLGESIPLACQDWANTKAAYRFLSNDRVSEADILAGHFESTRGRFVATDGPVLVLQDTTEFNYHRESPALIGSTTKTNSGRDKACENQTSHTLRHSHLVRTCVDCLAGDGEHTIADEMHEVPVKELHRVDVRDKKGNVSQAVLEIRYRRIHVLPPIGKQK
jgi:hypothetical protein